MRFIPKSKFNVPKTTQNSGNVGGGDGGTGLKGDKGDIGPAGPTGPAGPAGPTGAKGDKGDPFNVSGGLDLSCNSITDLNKNLHTLDFGIFMENLSDPGDEVDVYFDLIKIRITEEKQYKTGELAFLCDTSSFEYESDKD